MSPGRQSHGALVRCTGVRATRRGARLDALRCLAQKVLDGSVAAEPLLDQGASAWPFWKMGLVT